MTKFSEIEKEILNIRRQKEIYIATLCRDLNSAGDSIKWTRNVLKEYVNEMFETTGGLDALNFEYMEYLISDLKGRLEMLK